MPPTPCTTPEKIDPKSPQTMPIQSGSQTSSDLTSSDQDSDTSPHSTCSTQSRRILWLRLPITYNEASFSWLHGRLQVRMLNCISIPLPLSSDEESPMDSDLNAMEAESPTVPTTTEADSPGYPRQESPLRTPDEILPLAIQRRSHQWRRWLTTLDVWGSRSHQQCRRLPRLAPLIIQKES